MSLFFSIRFGEHCIRLLSASCLLLAFILTGCGSSSQPPPPAPDFSPVTTSVPALNLVAGTSSSIILSTSGINGFNSPITVTITGLPSGVTTSPSPLILQPGTPLTITFTAALTAPAAAATLTFTSTAGANTHSTSLPINITAVPPPDFSLSTSSSSLNIAAGASASTAITASALNGFNSPIGVTLSGLPAGITASPSPLTLEPGTPQTITFTAVPSAPATSATVTLLATSGTLTHSTTLTLNIAAAPPPDFSLSTSPVSITLTPEALGQPVSLSATAVNGFTSPVTLTLSGLPAGVTATPATLTLTPGTPQSITFTAAADTSLGTYTITATGQAGSLTHSATLALTIAVPTGIDATTYHYDNARTGLNPNETTLTPANVAPATFGKLNLLTTDGRVDAEPLYLSAVAGQTHNVLYIVTEHASIYAFDADTGTQLWRVSALAQGEAPSGDHGCGQITPEIGITSTPVIDRLHGANGVIFIVAMSLDNNGAYHQRLHALDLTTGQETAGSPTEITGAYPGTGDNSSNGQVIFDPGQYAERVGLLLLNQTLYLGWTSHCDNGLYTGWVMAYSENSLQQTHILNLTPNGAEGSVWMSGAGLAADTSGNIYFLDANGTLDTSFDANGFPLHSDYGNAIVKLSTASSLSVADFFEPYNTVDESNHDIDLGSGGALLLPDLTDSTGQVRHLLVGAGKDKNIYVADRDNLGKFNPANNSNLYQELPNALPGGIWSMPAYFNNTVYYGSVNDYLRAFPIVNAKLAATPSSTSPAKFGYPGATPSISSNGATNGIVWALESGTGSPAVLHAYDATNLAKELYNSKQAANNRDTFGNGNKFITPMIVNGKVYVGTPGGVAIFGLLP